MPSQRDEPPLKVGAPRETAMNSQVQNSVHVEQIAQELADSARALECPGGDPPDLRGLRDAVQQLQRIVDLIARQSPDERAGASSPSRLESFIVPDVEYNYDFWRDADDEGICGHRPAQ